MTTTKTTRTFKSLAGSMLRWFKRQAQAGVLALHLAVEPVPASRPKVTRWGTYYGKKYTRFMRDALPLAEGWEGPKTEGPVAVFIEHVVTKPRTGKKLWPRGDIDNFDKGPLDVMTKAEKFWKDDDQVVVLSSIKRYAEPDEDPGVRVWWYPLDL